MEETAARAAPSLADAVVALIALKVFLVIIAIDPASASPYAAPKAMVSRALLYITLPFAALAVLFEGVRARLGPIWYVGAAVVGVSAAATLVAVDQTTALYGAPRRLLGLTSILDGAATAALVAVFVRRMQHVAILAGAFGAAVLLNVAYGALQYLRLDPVKWVDPVMSGTIGNSTSFAAFMSVAFAVAWTAALVTWPQASRVARSALGATAVLTAVMVALSGARAPALALPAGAAAGVAIALRMHPSYRHLLRAWLPAAAAGALAAGAALLMSPAGARLISIVRGGDTSLEERQLIYGISFEALARRPVLGVGPDGLIAVYQSLRPPEAAQLTDVIAAGQTSAHGWLLSYAVGTGLLGATAAAALLAVTLWRAWAGASRERDVVRAAAFSALIAFTVQGLFTVSSIPSELVFWCLVGIVAAPHDPAPAAARRSPVWIQAALAAVVGIVLASTTLAAAGAQRSLLLSSAARQSGDARSAAAWAEDATRLDPRRADHWNTLGLAHTRRDAPAAIRAFERAVELAPYDSTYLLNLGAEEAVHAQRDAAHRERALRHAREAAARDPNWPPTLRRASEVLALFGQVDEALGLADRAVRLRPPTVEAYDWAARLHAAAGDADGALRLLEDVRRINWPSGEPPPEFRIRVATLEKAAGRDERAREAVGRPRLYGATLCGERCIEVTWRSVADLVTGDAAGSVTAASRYATDGRPLPTGSRVTARDGGRIVTLSLEAPVRGGLLLSISGVRDVFGSEVNIPRVRVVPPGELVPYDAAVLLDASAEAGPTADPAVRARLVDQVRSAAALYPDSVPVQRRAAEIALAVGGGEEAKTLAMRVTELARTPAQLDWAAGIHRRAGDPRGAVGLLERWAKAEFPSGQLPAAARVRLGEAYRAAGDERRALELVPPPRVVGAAACNAGCFFVYFESTAEMVTGDAPGSVTRTDAYGIDGQPLPPGAIFTVQSGGRVVAVELRSVVRAGQRLTIRDVRDTFGHRLDAVDVTLGTR